MISCEQISMNVDLEYAIRTLNVSMRLVAFDVDAIMDMLVMVSLAVYHHHPLLLLHYFRTKMDATIFIAIVMLNAFRLKTMVQDVFAKVFYRLRLSRKFFL